MNTLRRISRPLVKTFAVGAVMVAAALPAMALSGTASAATAAPTLTCDIASSAASPTCSNGYAIIGQGFGGNFYALGTGFANDQAVGGNVTLTTTAPGVTFSNVNETDATDLTATIDSTSATTPGFYPVTLTDDNGTVTFAVGLGVDNGPQITTIAGNAGTSGGAASTVTVTGTFLNGATATLTGVSPPVAGASVSNNAGTSLTFTVPNNVAAPGSYGISITSPWPTPANGVATSSYTLNGAATPVTITSVTPNELGIPVTNPSSQTVTISGTGFELGAVLTTPGYTGVTVSNPTFVNSTTMTELITVAPGTAMGQLDVSIVNPDTSNVAGTNLIGIGEPATNSVAGPTAPVAPALGPVTGSLTPGTSSILHVQGTSTFPITTGATVNVKQTGITNATESLTGTVVSVDSTNTATVRVQVPRFATTVTSAAVTAAATTLPVADASGLVSFPATVTIIDGASTENVTATAGTATSLTISATANAHASGVTVEFPFPAHVGDVLSIGNGTNTETALVTINAAPAAAYTASSTGATLGTLDPGSYSINAYVPGFGFTTGAAVTFQSFNGATPDNDGVTGTVTVVNGNTATLAVTVPKVRSSATGDYLTTTASAGQNALQLNSVNNAALTPAGNIAVGDSLTINPDSFYLTPETVTVTAVNAVTNVVGISPALADNHTGGGVGVGATITDNSDPQSLTDTVQADITNGAGGVDLVNPFFTFSTAGTITASSLNPVGAGANAAAETFTLSQPTPDTNPLDWAASSTTTGVTFGAVTAAPGGSISVPINVAAGTGANANVAVSLTDGLETYTGTIAIVAGPTITAVTTVGNLTAGGAFTVGLTGTNFIVGDGTTPNMTCSTSDPAVACVVDETVTDTSTTATVSLTAGPAMLNGTDSITLTDSGTVGAPVTLNVPTEGAGTLAGAFTVSGQPVITTIAPTVVPAGTTPTLTLTGTGFSLAPTVCTVVATHPNTTTTNGTCTLGAGGTATSATITAFTYAGYSTASGGDSLVFTVGTATSVASSPAVLVQTDPLNSFLVSSSIWDDFTSPTTISIGSSAVPFHIVGSGYLAGATVSLSTGTATVSQVTPNAIFGTITIPTTATVGTDTVTVTNTNGGADASVGFFNIGPAPAITSPGSVVPKAILDGVATTITITGTGFAAGAVVSGAVAGVDTFGAATVSNSANALDACTGLAGDFCNTISVLVTPVSFSGSTPILDGLVVTNPVGGGSVTVQNDLTINPVPAVTGVYYVPTFTTNAEVTINGTGFESGITASSANPDYTVLAVSSTPTTVTLLVTTDSNATSGTSSTITLTNPDGGSGTFPLNGGPNPNTVTPAPHATRVNGVAHVGKRSKVTISGTHFYGQPKITSNAKGTKVRVSGDNGKLLTVWITSAKTAKRGVHTLIIRFANGGQTSVKYNLVK